MQIKHRQPLLRGTNALIPPLQGDVRQPEIEELEAAAPWGKGIFATYGVAAERGVGPSSAVVAFKLDSLQKLATMPVAGELRIRWKAKAFLSTGALPSSSAT